MAVWMLVGQDRLLFLAGSSACPGASGERPSVKPKNLHIPSVGQDRQLIPTHLEGFWQACSHPSTTVVGKWSNLTAPGCKESLVLVYRPWKWIQVKGFVRGTLKQRHTQQEPGAQLSTGQQLKAAAPTCCQIPTWVPAETGHLVYLL